MAKVFISFLGTNNYLACNYINHKGKRVNNIKFVQEATIITNCINYDKFLFLLTEQACKNNWEDRLTVKDNQHCIDEGLRTRLLKHIEVKRIIEQPIPEGYTEEQIWEIFNIIYNHIDHNDEISIDVTHAFRSLPMLAIVLINYLKALKKVKVDGLYYGAFEALGSFSDAKEIQLEKRDVYILNLIAFSQLQDWSIAAHSLVNYGNSQYIVELTKLQINPILKNTVGQDLAASNFRIFANCLPSIFDSIKAVRGINIINNKSIGSLKSVIPILKKDLIAPLSPIIGIIEERIESLDSTDSIINGFKSVSWCIEYGWVQQGFTLLQEVIITAVLRSKALNEIDHLNRQIVPQAYTIYENKIDPVNWKDPSRSNYDLVDTILSSPYIALLCNEFNSLTDYRNDLNHCGFRENAKDYKKMSQFLEKLYGKIMKKIL